jgi:transcriptional regulator with XRE-family HTH domain
MEMQKPKIKLTLKAIRVNMGKTQEEMAKLYGVSKEVVFNWETYRTYPTVKDIPKIEEATGLKYDDIIFLPVDDD